MTPDDRGRCDMSHYMGGRFQRGATAIEFALVFAFFFLPLMLGMVDFSRLLYAYNSATEATRVGARVATVCDPRAPGIARAMRTFLPAGTVIPNPDYSERAEDGCTAGNVCAVRVTLASVTIPKFAFFLPGGSSYELNAGRDKFITVLPRESLQSVMADGSANPLCN